jgi:hypothetical protein
MFYYLVTQRSSIYLLNCFINTVDTYVCTYDYIHRIGPDMMEAVRRMGLDKLGKCVEDWFG